MGSSSDNQGFKGGWVDERMVGGERDASENTKS